MSMKNMGRLRRRRMKATPCSRRKMGCGAPVELMTMSALAGRLVDAFKRDHTAVERLCHGAGAGHGAIGNQDGAGALLDEVGGRPVRSFCRHRPKRLYDQPTNRRSCAPVRRRRRRWRRSLSRFRFRSEPFLAAAKALWSRCSSWPATVPLARGHGEGFLDLAENLRFAHDHRVQAGGDAKEDGERPPGRAGHRSEGRAEPGPDRSAAQETLSNQCLASQRRPAVRRDCRWRRSCTR